MWLVNFNYNFECDWIIELSNNKLSDNKVSDNKLSDNSLTSELVGNRSFLNQSQSRKFQFLWLILVYKKYRGIKQTLKYGTVITVKSLWRTAM